MMTNPDSVYQLLHRIDDFLEMADRLPIADHELSEFTAARKNLEKAVQAVHSSMLDIGCPVDDESYDPDSPEKFPWENVYPSILRNYATTIAKLVRSNDLGNSVIPGLREALRRLAKVAMDSTRVLPRDSIQKRFEDMSPDGSLMVMLQHDGDVCLSVYHSDESHNGPAFASIEFCAPCTGGGQSPNTLKALVDLARAIQIDNEQQPQNRRG